MKQILQTIAAITKRGWLDGDPESMVSSRNALFHQIDSIFNGIDTIQKLGLDSAFTCIGGRIFIYQIKCYVWAKLGVSS